jgi:hypothetical protein
MDKEQHSQMGKNSKTRPKKQPNQKFLLASQNFEQLTFRERSVNGKYYPQNT